MKNYITKTSILLISTILISGNIYADEIKTIEKVFSVDDGARFSLENINGKVDVRGTTDNDIKIIATITGNSYSEIDRVKVNMTPLTNGVSVETKYSEESKRYNNSAKVDYKVYLPTNVNDTELDLVNGSLSLTGVGGVLDVDLVNGSIQAENVNGNGSFNSVNGSINVSFDSIEQVNNIDVETVNGSIKVYLPVDANIDVDAETMHGSMINDFNLSVKKNFFSGKHMKGRTGDGATKISMESVNGSIKLLSN